jgi:tetratricopeptide (TPR) repeat protein
MSTSQDQPRDSTAWQAAPRDQPAPVRRGRLLGWVLLAMLASWLVMQAPLEVGRWGLARAMQLRDAGEKEAAYAQLDEAMKRFRRDPELILLRAEWQLDDGNKEQAIGQADRLLEDNAEDPKRLMFHSHFLQKCGEQKRAVEDLKKIEKISKRSGTPDRATALNALAYAQALADIELDDALASVNQALDLEPNNASILDTRGFVLYRLDKHDEAIEDMDRAVAGMKGAIEIARQELDESRGSGLATRGLAELRPKTMQELEPRTRRGQLENVLRSGAVIHYHRALVLKALDREEDAEKDWETARELAGREPDETLF